MTYQSMDTLFETTASWSGHVGRSGDKARRIPNSKRVPTLRQLEVTRKSYVL
jgi:hypothetical protein